MSPCLVSLNYVQFFIGFLFRADGSTRPLTTRVITSGLSFRETAQPVAVVTAVLPDTPTYHGATLSSFTSIALDPLPLIAFSLRIPSRMASALNALVGAPHPVAVIPSRDQHPRRSIHVRSPTPPVPFSLSEDGIPVLSGALGALSCRLIGRSLSLAGLGRLDSDLDELSRYEDASLAASHAMEEGEVQQASGGAGLASELFIARVLHVERVPLVEGDERDGTELPKLPLLYHRRRYTTVGTE
ncbi:hypothetical protein JVU11DRAFT_10423 [Chiua virens]|nr:hypothetical protein JVU11DRAFT_10423 [Chiua virens]